MFGPSGLEPKYGFKHFAEKQMESYAWDTDARVGALPAIGAEINVHEFNYSKTHVILKKMVSRLRVFLVSIFLIGQLV